MVSTLVTRSPRLVILTCLAAGLFWTGAPCASEACFTPPAPAGARPGSLERIILQVDGLLERSFLTPPDSLAGYCRRAEALLVEAGGEEPDDARLLARLGLVNARLAEIAGNAEKIDRACRTDRYCRAAIARGSTEALPYVLLGVLNYRISTMGWVERTLAKTLVGGLPPASLGDSERFLRQAVVLSPGSPFYHYALGRTLQAQDRETEAADELRLALAHEPTTPLDACYQEKARAHLLELERPKRAARESFREPGESDS